MKSLESSFQENKGNVKSFIFNQSLTRNISLIVQFARA